TNGVPSRRAQKSAVVRYDINKRPTLGITLDIKPQVFRTVHNTARIHTTKIKQVRWRAFTISARDIDIKHHRHLRRSSRSHRPKPRLGGFTLASLDLHT